MARRTPVEAGSSDATRSHAWRSLKSADFPAALAAPVMSKSPHFVLHHLAARPASSVWRTADATEVDLSTGAAPSWNSSVDNQESATQWWLGLVVPKRHARRAVTRTLLKRQMRAQADRQRQCLPPGQWVIRLRAPFDLRRFTSAASDPLRDAARSELAEVFAAVAKP